MSFPLGTCVAKVLGGEDAARGVVCGLPTPPGDDYPVSERQRVWWFPVRNKGWEDRWPAMMVLSAARNLRPRRIREVERHLAAERLRELALASENAEEAQELLVTVDALLEQTPRRRKSRR